MKKLLYFLPLILLIISCKEDPTQVQKDERFKTVYGFERTLVTGQVVGRLGDVGNNFCAPLEEQNMITYPNPTLTGLTLEFNINSNRTFEILIETALFDDELLEKLLSIRYPSTYKITQHKDYFKSSLTNGNVKVGTNTIQLDISQIGTGIYYIIYEDSEGNSDCYPLVVQR